VNNEIVQRIRKYALSKPEGLPYTPVSGSLVKDVELKLGFQLPSLLKACYEQIGNGGFGPGYGLIGLQSGAESDFGSLAETHHQLQSDQECEGNEWQLGLLPFCSWGCNIFSCVDCTNADFPVYNFEDFDVLPQGYSLQDFFEMWVNGVDILSLDDGEQVEVEIINPFTGKKSTVAKKKND